MTNALVRNPVGNWANGTTALEAELEELDAHLAATIDGDNGGTCAPAAPIILGGIGLQVTGPTLVTRGGSITLQDANEFTLQDSEFCDLDASHAGRTRKFLIACAMGRPEYGFTWRARRADGAMQSVSCEYNVAGTGWAPARLYVPIRAHDGSTLSAVTVGFRVGTAHTQLPATMPTLRVFRADSAGTIEALTSSAAGADASGYVAITRPASAAAWYAAGAAQSFAVTCDQHNTVDVTQYTYWLEIVEQRGLTGYPWALVYTAPVKAASTTNLALSGFAAVDTLVTPSDGDRVLAKNQTDATKNGPWVAHSGAWTRAPDFQRATDFTQGVVVPVDQGAINGGSFWQVASTTTAWTPGTSPPGATTWIVNTAYSSGDYVTPTASHLNGYYFKCTTAGTTDAATEPSWPATVGATVADGTAVWTCAGQTPTALAFVTKPDADTAAEGSAFVAHGNIWQAAVVEFTGIADTRWQ